MKEKVHAAGRTSGVYMNKTRENTLYFDNKKSFTH